jgi:ATP-dependent Clp protease adaptor protein ClpS
MTKFKENIKEKTLVLEEEVRKLVLYNDNVNTFDWVIECLMEVCHHTEEQATQCAWIVHYKGRHPVLSGSFDYLVPRHNALAERGLSVNIE